ncbi:MAG: NUDIX domain-containing protein [Hamadaea sp.]|nr:NUDIX domain-containing protein [Hamadaea sp.]
MPTPGFILALREKIGHDLLFLPGVTAVVLDDASRVLLVRRADNGRWTLVLGCLEPGEQPAAGAVREIWEETGVKAVVDRILRVQTMPEHVYPNGDHVQYFDVAFLCRPVGGEAVVNDDESTEVGWFALDELPDISARERGLIADALGGRPEAAFDR